MLNSFFLRKEAIKINPVIKLSDISIVLNQPRLFVFAKSLTQSNFLYPELTRAYRRELNIVSLVDVV